MRVLLPTIAFLALAMALPGCWQPRHPAPAPRQPDVAPVAPLIAPLPIPGRPSLIIFHARWCAPCRLMQETTLRDARVRELMYSYDVLTVDIDVDRERASRFQVTAVPCYVVIRDGRLINRGEGYRGPAEFANWLTSNR